MTRRDFLRAGAAAATGPYLALSQNPRQDRPPNFVIVLCDDLGYGDLACFGNKTIRTPNLDRFAGEGIRFTDCYAAAPVCSPSRAGMLTGRTPNRLGIYNWINEGSPVHLGREEATFAQILRDAGYATCHSGKWHCNGKFNDPAQPQPGVHGFEHWFSTQNNALPSHANPVNFVRNGKPVGPLIGYSSTVIVEEAIGWLGGVSAKPFCLFVCFHSPHEPVATAEEFTGMYREQTPRERAIYYGNVTQLDHEFGRLMKHLDDRKLRDDTLVFFTSDNGPETLKRYPGAARSYGTAAPLRSMKLSLYEGGCRVAGMARWPRRIRPGQASAEPVCGYDMLPTLVELAGAKAPSGRVLDGASMMPAFSGKRIERRIPLHWHYYNALDRPRASMRDGDWKILGIPDKPSAQGPGTALNVAGMEYAHSYRLVEFELYNLREDPAETTNLAAREPGRLGAMRDRLLSLEKEVRAEGPAWRF